MLSGHLTSKQMMVLSCFTVYGTIFFTLPRSLTQAAGHSGWVSILLGCLLATPLLWLISNIGTSMQEKSIIAYSLHVLGPVIGRLFGLLILLPLLLFSAVIVRLITELFVTLLLPETPIELLIIMMLVLRYYLAYGGMRSIAQWGELVMPGALLMLCILFGLSLNDVELQRITPFFNTTFPNVFKGALGICGLFAEMALLLFIYPQLKQKRNVFRTLLWCMGIVLVLFEITYFLTLGTYGSAYTQRLTFPVVEMIKDIDIFEFIEHLESPFLALWIFINLTKGTFTFYALCVGFQDWFGTSNYRSLMMPITVMILYLSLLPDNLYQAFVEFELSKGLSFCFYAFVLLLILWAAGKLKGRKTTG